MFECFLCPVRLIDLSHYLQPNDFSFIRKNDTNQTSTLLSPSVLKYHYNYTLLNLYKILVYILLYNIVPCTRYVRVYRVILLLLYYIVPKLCNNRQGWGGLLYTRNNTNV